MDLRKLAVPIATFLAMAVVAEGALRVCHLVDVDGRMVEHHPVRSETLAPNFQGSFRGVPVRTNRFGHRIPTTRPKPYERAKSPGVKRILVYGDSFAFGDEWPAEDSFVEQLQQRLDPSGTRIQVLNFGVPGYGPFQEANYVRESARSFQPDVVIVEFTETNDLVPFTPPAHRSSVQGLKTWLRRHWILYSVLGDLWYHGRDSMLAQGIRRRTIDRFIPARTNPAPARAPSASDAFVRGLEREAREYYERQFAELERRGRGWQQAVTSYQQISEWLSQHHVPLIIMVMPPTWDWGCGGWRCEGVHLSYQEVARLGQPFYQRLEQELGALTPYYLSLEKPLSPYALGEISDGTGHYGPKKNALVAAALQQQLQAMGAISQPPS